MRALWCLLLASCTHDIAAVDEIEVRPARDLDLLYVFDNSSDRGLYDQMAWQLHDLPESLAGIDGQLPSLHVGVVTTDLGTRGSRDSLPGPAIAGCLGEGDAGQLVTFGAGMTGNFLEDLRGPDGTRITNYDAPDLVTAMRALTNPAG